MAHRDTAGESGAFRILTSGYGFRVIDILWNRLQQETGHTIAHMLHPSLDRSALQGRADAGNLFCLRDDVRMALPSADREHLASLEKGDEVPTVHNMIMGDEMLRQIDYDDALAYASFMAKRMEQLYCEFRPSVVVSGFDAFHSSMSMAVARSMGIPWFALGFSALPTGLTGFCTGLNLGSCFSARVTPPETLRELAEQTLRGFESQRLVAPTFVSENCLAVVLRRIPGHLKGFVKAVRRDLLQRFDRYTQPPLRRSLRHYLRKRRNLLMLPKKWFLETPLATPYLFLGLHMQPEMAIDVWAPFYSDQFNVIEAIARSTPPTHKLLVKLHKIDADNYSRSQIDRLRRLPGVEIVSPFASSRAFIEKAALVFSVQGTITLESAMLGRPVLAFGETSYFTMPSVTRVGRVTELPAQVRDKLSETPPAREEIIQGLVRYLGRYAPGCYNDWEAPPSEEQIRNLGVHFAALRELLERQAQGGDRFFVRRTRLDR